MVTREQIKKVLEENLTLTIIEPIEGKRPRIGGIEEATEAMVKLIVTEDFPMQNLFLSVKTKLDEIAEYSNGGRYFDGISIGIDGIAYKTSTWYSGCGREDYIFYVSWDELDQPIEYFKEKFEREKELEKQEEEKREARLLKEKEEKELKLLQELKAKYND